MNYLKLRKIKRLYFPYQELSTVLNITNRSAKVFAARYVKKGYLLRLRRNFYILKERWDTLNLEERLIIANIIEVPSYISLMTALGYHGVTTQVQRDFVESICIQRTKEIEIEKSVFNYTKINKDLYFGFIKEKGFFIAEPEKALLDTIYLTSINRYKFDLTSIDLEKIDKNKIKTYINKYPDKTREYWREHVRSV